MSHVRSAHLSWFHQRGTLYLYHDLHGSVLSMSEDVRDLIDAFARPRVIEEVVAERGERARAFIRTLVAHACLCEEGTDELEGLLLRVPVKGPWIVVHEDQDGELCAVLGRNLETPPRQLRFGRFLCALWRRIDGERTVAEIIAALEADASEAERPGLRNRALLAIAWLCHSEVQLIRTSEVPLSFYKGRGALPADLLSTMPYPRCGAASPQRGEVRDDLVDLRAYHEHVIADPEAQFEELETTLSHLFRAPHPALAGRTYAEAMAGALREHGLLKENTQEIIEVGGGLGFFAEGLTRALLAAPAHRSGRFRYRVLDISPALHRAQTARLRPLSHVASAHLGDAEALDLPEESVDLVLSNEVIADLRTARVRCHLGARPADPVCFDPPEDDQGPPAATLSGNAEAIDLIARHQIDLGDPPEELFVNIGAMRFMERLWRVLRPGGAALITEFGDRFRHPVESIHLDHAEYSIHFGALMQVAERLGFHVELRDVLDLLGFDPDIEVLACTRSYFRNLRALLAERGVPLSKVAYTRDQLATLCEGRIDLTRIETLRFERLEDRVMGLRPREFKALILRKPPREDHSRAPSPR